MVASEYKKIQDAKVKDKHNKDGVYKSVKAKNLALKKIDTELSKLRNLKIYLETSPSIDYLKAKLEKTEKKLQIINDGFDNAKASNPKEIKSKKAYLKIAGHTSVLLEIQNLKYLIGE